MQRGAMDATAASGGLIKPNDRLDSFERLQIYNQQYWWRLLGTFGTIFADSRGARRAEIRPARRRVSGSCGRRHGRCAILAEAGEFFRASRIGRATRKLALDMARVEWARVVAFDGPVQPPVTHARCATSPGIDLNRPPAVRHGLLDLTFPLDALLGRLKESRGERDRQREQCRVQPAAARRRRLPHGPRRNPIYLAVHRSKIVSVYYKRLRAGSVSASLRARAPAHRSIKPVWWLATEGTDAPEVLAGKVQAWFGEWMSFGWLISRNIGVVNHEPSSASAS